MSEQINHSPEASRVAAFDGTYREVMSLLEQARALALTPWFAVGVERGAGSQAPSLLRLEASCEALRVTSRLTHCLAWVMVHKAIHAGELTAEAAFDPANRLNGGEVCLAMGGESNPRLPKALRALLTASRVLYLRLARLDERMAAAATAE